MAAATATATATAAGGGGGGGGGGGPGTRTKTKKKHFVPQRVKVLRSADPVLAVLGWGINHQWFYTPKVGEHMSSVTQQQNNSDSGMKEVAGQGQCDQCGHIKPHASRRGACVTCRTGLINELSQVPQPVMLLPDDFKASSKIKVTYHLFNRENLPSHFKFKEYCPQVFRNIRERFNIDDQDFQVSLTRSPPTNEGESGGGRFLMSYDRTLVIKEISSEDVADVHNLLSHYHQYIVKCHGTTLLPQFLGMYRVSVDSEERYMLVMRNVFGHRLTVHRKYDLKGSLVSREATDKEKVKELPTLKDIDFRNMNQKAYISEGAKKDFMEKLKRDVEFLVQLKIMDYSLLLGIHDVKRAELEEEEDAKEEEEEGEGELGGVAWVGSYGTSPEGIGGYLNSQKPLGPGEFDPHIDVYAIKSAENSPQKEVYFMGLIDILTQYDAKKKAAHAAKTVKHGAGAEISTVHPDQYAKRFLDFVTNVFA